MQFSLYNIAYRSKGRLVDSEEFNIYRNKSWFKNINSIIHFNLLKENDLSNSGHIQNFHVTRTKGDKSHISKFP